MADNSALPMDPAKEPSMPGDGDAATADDKENGASMGPAGAKSTAMDTAGAQSAGAEGGAPAADGDAQADARRGNFS